MNCKACGNRLGEGSLRGYCPSCDESYSAVRLKRQWVPEWVWAIACACWRGLNWRQPCYWLSEAKEQP